MAFERGSVGKTSVPSSVVADGYAKGGQQFTLVPSARTMLDVFLTHAYEEHGGYEALIIDAAPDRPLAAWPPQPTPSGHIRRARSQ